MEAHAVTPALALHERQRGLAHDERARPDDLRDLELGRNRHEHPRSRLRNDLMSVSSSSVDDDDASASSWPQSCEQLDGLLRRRLVERVAGDEAERARLRVVAQRGAQRGAQRPSCSP